jgi:hypothetical protein
VSDIFHIRRAAPRCQAPLLRIIIRGVSPSRAAGSENRGNGTLIAASLTATAEQSQLDPYLSGVELRFPP